MSTIDFRGLAFDPNRIELCGKDIGRKTYYKLYLIENVVRILIYSVLNAQIGSNWWITAVSLKLRKKVENRQKNYLQSPWHSSPGNHELYYIDITDLNEIIRVNSHLFLPIVPDIDQWISRIEQIRLPRNVVAHMNWPNSTDRGRIDVFYADFLQLIQHLTKVKGFIFIIPK